MSQSYCEQRQLHFDITNVGLRAQGTAVGLVQLCIELRKRDIIDDAALTSIKETIADELHMGGGRRVAARNERSDIRARLDRIFAGQLSVGPAAALSPRSDAD